MKFKKNEAQLFANRISKELDTFVTQEYGKRKVALLDKYYKTANGKKVKALLNNLETKSVVNTTQVNHLAGVSSININNNILRPNIETITNEFMITNLKRNE